MHVAFINVRLYFSSSSIGMCQQMTVWMAKLVTVCHRVPWVSKKPVLLMKFINSLLSVWARVGRGHCCYAIGPIRFLAGWRKRSSWSRVSLVSFFFSGWPLCRQCEIPWHFPDGLQHSAALGMLSVTSSRTSVTVRGGARNATLDHILNILDIIVSY